MPSPVVDLSHWNPTPDWTKLKAGGVVGVILKATEGTGYTDPTFASRRSGAKAAGLCHSSYHFLRPGKIEQQVDRYLGVVQPEEGERICWDFEDDSMKLDELRQAITILWQKRADLQQTV